MTRLTTDDIKHIVNQLERYDMQLARDTGYTLRGIACHAFGIPEDILQSIAASVEVGIIPFQSGQGIIDGFCETVKHIVRYIGFKAFVTKHTDVAGIAEAVEKNAEVLMMADDQRFVALNIKSHRMADNAADTGKGYVAGLDIMAGGLEGKRVLVIGCGPVGRNAAMNALQRGADVSVFDIRPQQCSQLAREVYKSMKKKINIEPDLDRALLRHQLLVDAADTPGIIDIEHIYPSTYAAAPGIPLGVTPAAVKKLSGRLLHDPLQTGVATMAVDAVMSRSVEEWRIMLPYGTYIAQVANPHRQISLPHEADSAPIPDEPGEDDKHGKTVVLELP